MDERMSKDRKPRIVTPFKKKPKPDESKQIPKPSILDTVQQWKILQGGTETMLCKAQRDADAEYYEALIANLRDEIDMQHGWTPPEKLGGKLEQVRAEVLKGLGKWMKDLDKTGHLNRTIILYLIENLERGQFPQE